MFFASITDFGRKLENQAKIDFNMAKNQKESIEKRERV